MVSRYSPVAGPDTTRPAAATEGTPNEEALDFVVVALWAVLSLGPALAGSPKTRNVVLIVTDGLRWQEVFTGADPLLLNDKAGGSWTPVAELRQKYWSDDPGERRRLLMPFLWGTVAKRGQIFGNQQLGSKAEVTNGKWFSYPGYNEMASGVADPRIDKNEFGPNPNETVFEWLNTQPGLAGKVEIFGTWSVFHDIFNDARSHLPVRSGATLVDPADRSPRGKLLLELYRTTTRLEDEDPFDSFLYAELAEHLKAHHPRVLFVGFGDTDNWAHVGRYDACSTPPTTSTASSASCGSRSRPSRSTRDRRPSSSRPTTGAAAGSSSGRSTASRRRAPATSGSR